MNQTYQMDKMNKKIFIEKQSKVKVHGDDRNRQKSRSTVPGSIARKGRQPSRGLYPETG